MYKVARLPDRDRMDLFRAASQKMGINEAIVEKDFWVCWILDYLFHKNRWQNKFSFKGGTSLSKAYNLIQRFSEDIDLIVDWTLLGFKNDEPWEDRSNTGQDRFNKEANNKTKAFLADSFIPVLKADISQLLAIDASITADNEQNVFFNYPGSFTDTAILQAIRLEIGPLAAWVPAEVKVIQPYAADYYPEVFEKNETSIRTVMAKRTFWEKATILHQEAHRDENKLFPPRYSRHYYDLHRMVNSPVQEEALADLSLLYEVVAFKKRFYRCPWARYDDAKPGTFRLTPPPYQLKKLQNDYRSMQPMLFGNKPSFQAIISSLAKLEARLNMPV
jgi:hypothetical protein